MSIVMPCTNKVSHIFGVCRIEEHTLAAEALVIGSLIGSWGLAGGNNLGELLHQKVVLEATLASTDLTFHCHPSPTLRNSVWVRLPSPSMSIILKSCSACLQAFSSVPPRRASYEGQLFSILDLIQVTFTKTSTTSPVSVELTEY